MTGGGTRTTIAVLERILPQNYVFTHSIRNLLRTEASATEEGTAKSTQLRRGCVRSVQSSVSPHGTAPNWSASRVMASMYLWQDVKNCGLSGANRQTAINARSPCEDSKERNGPGRVVVVRVVTRTIDYTTSSHGELPLSPPLSLSLSSATTAYFQNTDLFFFFFFPWTATSCLHT